MSFADNPSIVKLLNFSWASILASHIKIWVWLVEYFVILDFKKGYFLTHKVASISRQKLNSNWMHYSILGWTTISPKILTLQLLALSDEGRIHIALDLQLSMPKVEGQRNIDFSFQLLAPKVQGWEHFCLDLQLSLSKVEGLLHCVLPLQLLALIVETKIFCHYVILVLVISFCFVNMYFSIHLV